MRRIALAGDRWVGIPKGWPPDVDGEKYAKGWVDTKREEWFAEQFPEGGGAPTVDVTPDEPSPSVQEFRASLGQ